MDNCCDTLLFPFGSNAALQISHRITKLTVGLLWDYKKKNCWDYSEITKYHRRDYSGITKNRRRDYVKITLGLQWDYWDYGGIPKNCCLDYVKIMLGLHWDYWDYSGTTFTYLRLYCILIQYPLPCLEPWGFRRHFMKKSQY